MRRVALLLTWPVRSGLGADRVARSEVVTFQRGRHVGRHLRKPRYSACVLGLSARRHYWLAPRSDDAVGAAMLGQGAGEIAAVACQCVPLRFCKLDWGRTNVSCLKSDEISEPCGHRFSGDLTGFGRCVTGINRADTASERLDAARGNRRRVQGIYAAC